MNRDQKAAVVDEIAEQLQAAHAVFAVDYRGLSVAQAADLRTKLRDSDTKFRVVKNSLSERAADKAGVDTLKPLLEGPTALALVHGDAALAAKALNDAARTMHVLEFKGGVMNGTTLSADDVRSIARLPSREILNAQLVGTIAAPITGLVRGLNALIAGLAIQLKQIAEMDPPVLVPGEAVAVEAEVAVAEAEPVAAAEAESEPAAGELEPVAAAEAESEPAAGEPEPVAAAEPEPEPAAAAEAEPQAAAPAEPEAAGEPEPESEAAAEPAAANEQPKESEQDTAADAEPSDA